MGKPTARDEELPRNITTTIAKATNRQRIILFERHHDLNYLIDSCALVERARERFQAEADKLTPVAAAFR